MLLDYKTLKQRYGNALARQIRDEKKQAEENKTETDTTVYWMKHPDVGDHSEAGGFEWCDALGGYLHISCCTGITCLWLEVS